MRDEQRWATYSVYTGCGASAYAPFCRGPRRRGQNSFELFWPALNAHAPHGRQICLGLSCHVLGEDVLGEFSRMLSGPPGSVCGPHAIPEALNASVRAPRLLARNRAALPIGPAAASEAKGLRRRCDGAVPGRDRWHGSSVFSSPPPSRVLRMGQPLPDRPSLFRTERERTPRTVDGSDGGAPTTRRARSSLASEPHTKRNAPRRRLAPEATHTVTQAAATPSSPSTRTGAARSTSGSCGRSSRPWARSRRRRSSSR